MKKEEYKKNDALFKALENAGFSEEEINEFIKNGDINLQKSKDEKEMDHSEEDEKKNIVNDEKHIENLEEDKEEDEEDVEDLEKDKKEKVEKGLSLDILKSYGDLLSDAIISKIESNLNARLEKIEKSLEIVSNQTPSFKSVNLSSSIIEKSLDQFKDDDNKLIVDIIKQRPAAKMLIEKAIENADDNLMKSIGDDAKAFLANPEAESIGEDLAMYMYKQQGVKFVK